jgi:hypothetical protein
LLYWQLIFGSSGNKFWIVAQPLFFCKQNVHRYVIENKGYFSHVANIVATKSDNGVASHLRGKVVESPEQIKFFGLGRHPSGGVAFGH